MTLQHSTQKYRSRRLRVATIMVNEITAAQEAGALPPGERKRYRRHDLLFFAPPDAIRSFSVMPRHLRRGHDFAIFPTRSWNEFIYIHTSIRVIDIGVYIFYFSFGQLLFKDIRDTLLDFKCRLDWKLWHSPLLIIIFIFRPGMPPYTAQSSYCSFQGRHTATIIHDDEGEDITPWASMICLALRDALRLPRVAPRGVPRICLCSFIFTRNYKRALSSFILKHQDGLSHGRPLIKVYA